MLSPVLVLAALAAVSASAATGSSGELPSMAHGESPTSGVTLERFVVPHMRSVEFSAGIGGRVTTVLTVTNGGATSCSAEIDFYFASNSGTPPAPVCTLSLTLAPLLALGVDTINACSRPIPGDRWTLCTATCAPALTFNQGKAVVRAEPACAANLALDARLYHSDPSDDVVAVSSLQVASDLDGDSVYDPNDNCSAIPNPDQRDTNADGIGNRCDPDLNNDCAVNFPDLAIMKAVFFSANADADLTGDGVVNFPDLAIMKDFFFGAPGPSDLPDTCL